MQKNECFKSDVSKLRPSKCKPATRKLVSFLKWNAARERKSCGQWANKCGPRSCKFCLLNKTIFLIYFFENKNIIFISFVFKFLGIIKKSIYYPHCLNKWKTADSSSSSLSLKFRFYFSFQTTTSWSVCKSVVGLECF